MKTATALFISIGILFSVSHSAKALTLDFETLAPVITARADFDHLFSGSDTILANLDHRMDGVQMPLGHRGQNGRFFHMPGYRASDLLKEMAVLTPPRRLTVDLIIPVGFDTAGLSLDGPWHKFPGLKWHHSTTPDNPAPTPEPATLLLVGSGLLVLGWSARRMNKEN